MLKADVDAISLTLHGLVFSVFGLAVSYLHVDPAIGSTAQILPAAIAATVVIFQMLGRLNPHWGVPLESHASLAGATAGVFCFLFGSIYFEALLISKDTDAPPPSSDTLGNYTIPNPNEPTLSDGDAADQISNDSMERSDGNQ